MDQGEPGQQLRSHNEQIMKCLLDLKEQRNDLDFIIDKQYEERRQIESDIEKLTYKLCLVNKSLAQRIKAKSYYDKTIEEVEQRYNSIVENSDSLRQKIFQEHQELEKLMNKRTGTEGEAPTGEPISRGQSKFVDEDECDCTAKAGDQESGYDDSMESPRRPITLKRIKSQHQQHQQTSTHSGYMVDPKSNKSIIIPSDLLEHRDTFTQAMENSQPIKSSGQIPSTLTIDDPDHPEANGHPPVTESDDSRYLGNFSMLTTKHE